METLEEALVRVDHAANDFWKETTLSIIKQLAEDMESFTTDDVWSVLDTLDVSTPEPRALGALMRRAVSYGYVEPTSTFILSTRPICHRRPIKVWKSLL